MKKILLSLAVLSSLALADGVAEKNPPKETKEVTIQRNNTIILSVIGQGIAPDNLSNPAQAAVLAKRAAIADAYRLLSEKLYGVKVEGRDYIRNMVVQKSEVRTSVSAIMRHAEISNSVYKDGLFQVEMELKVVGSKWYDELLASAN